MIKKYYDKKNNCILEIDRDFNYVSSESLLIEDQPGGLLEVAKLSDCIPILEINGEFLCQN